MCPDKTNYTHIKVLQCYSSPTNQISSKELQSILSTVLFQPTLLVFFVSFDNFQGSVVNKEPLQFRHVCLYRVSVRGLAQRIWYGYINLANKVVNSNLVKINIPWCGIDRFKILKRNNFIFFHPRIPLWNKGIKNNLII